MIRIQLHKAQAAPDRQIPDTTIEIRDEVPDFVIAEGWEKAYRDYYDTEAKRLVDTLLACLPGGTLDRVLALLLQRAASLHRIQWPQEKT